MGNKLSTNEIARIVEKEYRKTLNKILRETFILIFGPGKGSEKFFLRLKVRDTLRKMGCKTYFPEEIAAKINTIVKEEILARNFNLIYVLLIGLGPSMEFTHYLHRAELAPKFRLFQESKYRGKKSFANELIKHFCKLYRHCYLFDDEKKLIRIAKKCLKNYVNFVIVYKHRPY